MDEILDLALVLETQRPIIQTIFLFRLLSGKFLNHQQLDRDMHLAKVELQAPGFLVMILGMDRETGDSEATFSRKTLLRFLFQEKYHASCSLFAHASDDMMEDGITFLLPLPQMDRKMFLEDFKEALREWHADFRDLSLKTRFSTRFGRGIGKWSTDCSNGFPKKTWFARSSTRFFPGCSHPRYAVC